MPSLNSRLKSAIRAIHLWVGLAAGILFCLMSLSGSLIVFRAGIEDALRPRWTATSQARPQSVLTEAARNIRQRWPDAKIVSVYLPLGKTEPYEFQTRLPDGSSEQVFTDSRSGEVLGTFELSWLNWIVDLHHELRLGPAGKKAVGIIGICLFLASLTGLTLWLVRKPDWKTAIRLRTGKSWKVANFDLHRATGLLANAVLLIVSITGIYLAYPDTIESALGVAPSKAPRGLKAAAGEAKPIEELIAAAENAIPGATVRQLRFAGGSGRPVTFRLWAPGDVRAEGSNRVTLDPVTARILQVDRISDWSPIKRLTQSAAPVHYAEWGGLFLRIAWAAIGLVPPVLFVSGFLIWLAPYLARRKAARAASAADPISIQELVR